MIATDAIYGQIKEKFMCLQCMTKARMIVKDVLPGYGLVKATVGHEDWPKGWYGLVRCNNPDYIWEGKPLMDPTFYMTDEQINNLSSKGERADREFFRLVEKMEPQFEESPELGYALYTACKKDGYNEKKHGYRLMPWLVHHMAEKMKRKKSCPM